VSLDGGELGSVHLGGVFDGVGGHLAGDQASELGCSVIMAHLCRAACNVLLDPDQDSAPLEQAFRLAFERAGAAVLGRGLSEPECRGMATTAVVFIAFNGELRVAWAGDSRAYLFSGGRLRRLTHDHTVGRRLIESGAVAADHVHLVHGHKHLARCLGMAGITVPETDITTVAPGDLVLAVTDGVTDPLGQDEIERHIAHYLAEIGEVDGLAESLVGAALAAGGGDNATAVVHQYAGLGSTGATGDEAGELATSEVA
jgi:protein phosphatase